MRARTLVKIRVTVGSESSLDAGITSQEALAELASVHRTYIGRAMRAASRVTRMDASMA